MELSSLKINAMVEEMGDNMETQIWNVTVFHDEFINGVTFGPVGTDFIKICTGGTQNWNVTVFHDELISGVTVWAVGTDLIKICTGKLSFISTLTNLTWPTVMVVKCSASPAIGGNPSLVVVDQVVLF